MPTYRFKAKDQTGRLRKGSLTASDEHHLRSMLDSQGVVVLEAHEVGAAAPLRVGKVSGSVAARDLAVFSWQLCTALDAGVPISEALDITGRQTGNPTLQKILSIVRRELQEGSSFSDALRFHPNAFSDMYVNMIRAGEIAGALPEMLKKQALFLEKQMERRSKIIGAFAYPSILLVVTIGVAIFLLTFVLPRFTDVFAKLGGDLPLPTRILMGVGSFMSTYWLYLLGAIAGLVVLFRLSLMTDAGRLAYDTYKFKIPIVGPVLHKIALSRLSDTLSTLVSGGVPILGSLDITASTAGNTAIAKLLREIAEKVKEGHSITEPMKKSPLIPELMTSMVAIGEEAGALDSMLQKVSIYFDREVERTVNTFTKMIEPILLIFMTAIIGSIAVSIFLPLADIMTRLGQK